MGVTTCGLCCGGATRGRCPGCGGVGLVSDEGLLADIAKQHLEDDADDRAEAYGAWLDRDDLAFDQRDAAREAAG